jgi:hypothetical protein
VTHEPETTLHALGAAADALERLLDDEDALRAVEPAAVQRLLAALVKVYAAKLEAGGELTPYSTDTQTPSPTDTVVVASDLLASVEMEPFELAMWRAWGNVRGTRERGEEHGS